MPLQGESIKDAQCRPAASILKLNIKKKQDTQYYYLKTQFRLIDKIHDTLRRLIITSPLRLLPYRLITTSKLH